jgi:hypothetical protein
MPRALDPAISKILSEYGETPKDACWDCHGTWVVYHKAIERMAARAKIVFAAPQVIEARSAEKTAVICVTGTMADRSEWSFGEASPANNKNAYPYAMAEKRAKDRVVLKLLGLHGLAYSEDESDDFKGTSGGETLPVREAGAVKQGLAPASPITPDQAAFIAVAETFMLNASDEDELDAWAKGNGPEAKRLGIVGGTEAGKRLREIIEKRRVEIREADMPAGQFEAAE